MTLDKQAQRGMQLAADQGWTLLRYADNYAAYAGHRTRRADRYEGGDEGEPELAINFRTCYRADNSRTVLADARPAQMPPVPGTESAAARRIRREMINAALCVASYACLVYAACMLQGVARAAMLACSCVHLLGTHRALEAANRIRMADKAVRLEEERRRYLR